MSICPKNKSSKGRRDKRRANWKMSAPTLVKCSKCGELMMPHRVCKNCGSYNKKEVFKNQELAVLLTLDFFVSERANLSLIYGMIYSIFSSRCIRRNRPCRQSRK